MLAASNNPALGLHCCLLSHLQAYLRSARSIRARGTTSSGPLALATQRRITESDTPGGSSAGGAGGSTIGASAAEPAYDATDPSTLLACTAHDPGRKLALYALLVSQAFWIGIVLVVGVILSQGGDVPAATASDGTPMPLLVELAVVARAFGLETDTANALLSSRDASTFPGAWYAAELANASDHDPSSVDDGQGNARRRCTALATVSTLQVLAASGTLMTLAQRAFSLAGRRIAQARRMLAPAARALDYECECISASTTGGVRIKRISTVPLGLTRARARDGTRTGTARLVVSGCYPLP